jgi:hypothetical protein
VSKSKISVVVWVSGYGGTVDDDDNDTDNNNNKTTARTNKKNKNEKNFGQFRRVRPTRCNVSQFIYFCKTLYMFQTVFSVHHQELKTTHTADRYCYLLLAAGSVKV